MTKDGNGEIDLKVVLGHQGPDHPVKPVNYGKVFAFHENSNYSEVSPHTSQNGHHQKNLQMINTGENVEKRELIQPLWRTVCRYLKKLYIYHMTNKGFPGWGSGKDTRHKCT